MRCGVLSLCWFLDSLYIKPRGIVKSKVAMSDQESKDKINTKKNEDNGSLTGERQKINLALVVSAILGAFLLLQFFDVDINVNYKSNSTSDNGSLSDTSDLEGAVFASDGVTLPANWGNLGKQMVESGVINAEEFEAIYESRGGLTDAELALLYGDNNRNLKIDSGNAGTILNLLWAFGLSNKNSILENGPMIDPKYGGAGGFASTGGWSLADGNVMDHYSMHAFVILTPEQQALVEEVSKNIYRPCCGNSTYFPDCNHGMAMLGLLELMASNGASEEEMYEAALAVNSYWFPDTYLTIAKYFGGRGVDWDEVSPKDILGSAYSSAQGFSQILAEVEPVKAGSGNSCGV